MPVEILYLDRKLTLRHTSRELLEKVLRDKELKDDIFFLAQKENGDYCQVRLGDLRDCISKIF